MAYYGDGYMWPQEQYPTYDLLDYQDSVSSSAYESYAVVTYDPYTVSDQFHHPQDYDYDYDYGRDSCLPAGTHEINYFAYNYMEPKKLIAYEPAACDTGYVSYHTQYSISYPEKDLEFNEPEFVEYDSTPYGGGYDIVSVYGKPLPPSDQTCYPRSNPKPIQPTTKPTEPTTKPNPESKPESKPMPIPTPIPLVEPKPEPVPVPVPVLMPPAKPIPASIPLVVPEPEPEPEPEHVAVPVTEPLVFGEYSHPDYGYDYLWPEYDRGYGIGVGYDYGYGKQVVQVPPCEYEPEVVDLCESMFGSWPCLARIRKQQQMGVDKNPRTTNYPENRTRNPWEDCVNYIFAGYNQ